MADTLNGSIMKLADPGVWERGVYVLAGFAVPEILGNVVSGMDTGFNVPGEAYGAATAAGAYMFLDQGKLRNNVTAGAAGSVLLNVAERFDVVDTVTGIGSGS